MRRKRGSSRVFTLSLNEVTLVLVFFLLSLFALPESGETSETHRRAAEALAVFDDLGISPGDLRRAATRLIDARLVEKDKVDLVAAIDRLITNNAELRKELASAKSKAEEAEDRRKEAEGTGTGEGSEPGSCWLTASGDVEYLAEVTMTDAGFEMSFIYPTTRAAVLSSLGASADSLPSGALSVEAFEEFSRPVYFATMKNRCRLFVRMVDRTSDKRTYKTQRRIVEKYYFVVEAE